MKWASPRPDTDFTIRWPLPASEMSPREELWAWHWAQSLEGWVWAVCRGCPGILWNAAGARLPQAWAPPPESRAGQGCSRVTGTVTWPSLCLSSPGAGRAPKPALHLSSAGGQVVCRAQEQAKEGVTSSPPLQLLQP